MVDDETDSLTMMRFILESKGAQVVSANSALLALNKLNENQFDLLISDLGMAEMDGYDLIRKVREKQHLNQDNLPAIALTDLVSTDEREQGFLIKLLPLKPCGFYKLPQTLVGGLLVI